MATTIAFKDNTAPEIRCANFAKKMEELGIDGEIVDGVLFAAYNINTKQWGIWGPSAVKTVQINFAEDFCWLEYTYAQRQIRDMRTASMVRSKRGKQNGT